jgi:DNA-binding transcriptional LysR family regulator
MSVNVHLLRLFSAVVEHDGVVNASRALHLSQPAVSRAVRELEKQLGVSLLDRSSRRVRLTPDGAEVYAKARAVFAAERGLEQVVEELKGVARGVLRIAGSTTIATYVLPRIISEFAREHPAIEVRLSAVHTRIIVEMLRRYEVDVALAEAPVNEPEIEVVPWRTDHMVMIAGPTHRLASAPVVTPADLADELFVLREPESGTRQIVTRALEAADIHVRRSMSIDGTEVIKQIVAGGLGLAVVSRFAVEEQLAHGRLVALRIPSLQVHRPFNRLALRGQPTSTAAQAFLALLREHADRGAAGPGVKGRHR